MHSLLLPHLPHFFFLLCYFPYSNKFHKGNINHSADVFTASAPDSQALQRSPGRAEGHHSAVGDSLGAGEVGITNNRIVLTLFITTSECAVSHPLQNINTLNGHRRGTEIVLNVHLSPV